MPSYIIPKRKERDIVRVIHVFPVEIGKKAYAERLGYEPSEIESAGHFRLSIVDTMVYAVEIESGSYTLGIEHSKDRDMNDLSVIEEFLRV